MQAAVGLGPLRADARRTSRREKHSTCRGSRTCLVTGEPCLPSNSLWRCPVAGCCAGTSPDRLAMENRDEL